MGGGGWGGRDHGCQEEGEEEGGPGVLRWAYSRPAVTTLSAYKVYYGASRPFKIRYMYISYNLGAEAGPPPRPRRVDRARRSAGSCAVVAGALPLAAGAVRAADAVLVSAWSRCGVTSAHCA
jgi:hypothetical protein